MCTKVKTGGPIVSNLQKVRVGGLPFGKQKYSESARAILGH
jgi:hypothetical protein